MNEFAEGVFPGVREIVGDVDDAEIAIRYRLGELTIVGGDLATEVPKLKDRSGGELLVSGSVTLVQSLLAQNLLDELSLLVHPLVLGSGRRLLDSIDGTRRLELVESKTFGSGVVSLAYRRAPDGDGTAEQEP